MLRLGFPEVAHGLDLGDDLAIPEPGCIHIGDRVLGDALLLLVDIVDAGPVGGSAVVALTILCRRIVDCLLYTSPSPRD